MKMSRRSWRNLRQAAGVFQKWVKGDRLPEDVDTPRGLLKFLDAIGPDFLEAVVFIGAAWRVWRQQVCGDDVTWLHYAGCKGSIVPAVLLALMVGVMFHLSRINVAAELSITQLLFSDAKIPKRWTGSNDSLWVTVQVLVWFSAYVALAAFAGDIVIVSGMLFLIACLDWNSRRAIHHRIRIYFADPHYAPVIGEPDYRRIQESRRVMSDHLFRNPHLWKEGIKATCCGLAFSLALAWRQDGSAALRAFSYAVLLVTLIVNEYVTIGWRNERDRLLDEIEREAA
jgi:hypothetical protein